MVYLSRSVPQFFPNICRWFKRNPQKHHQVILDYSHLCTDENTSSWAWGLDFFYSPFLFYFEEIMHVQALGEIDTQAQLLPSEGPQFRTVRKLFIRTAPKWLIRNFIMKT